VSPTSPIPGADASVTTTGDAANAYLTHRQNVLGRLARVDAALDQWAEYDACFRELLSTRRPLAVPVLPRLGLRYLHAVLVEELALIDGHAG
jgi:hypothetical protein